jgi:hypothetical protein
MFQREENRRDARLPGQAGSAVFFSKRAICRNEIGMRDVFAAQRAIDHGCADEKALGDLGRARGKIIP